MEHVHVHVAHRLVRSLVYCSYLIQIMYMRGVGIRETSACSASEVMPRKPLSSVRWCVGADIVLRVEQQVSSSTCV